jgi:hypothetical protein
MKITTGFYLTLARLRRWVRLVVATLAGHGVFDLKHFRMLTNPNVPIWLALLWIGFDIAKTTFKTFWVVTTSSRSKAFGLRLLEAQSS